MDYKEKYNKLVESIKVLQETNPSDEGIQNWVNDNVPELKESDDERIRKEIIELVWQPTWKTEKEYFRRKELVAWLEKKQGGEQNLITLPKWKYKKDDTPLLRDSLILNKYGCVGKSPSGALVSDVWVIDYTELAKLPKEEVEKQGEQKASYTTIVETGNGGINTLVTKELPTNGCDDEQKPADKVGPKFHGGDWVIDKQGIVHQIANVMENVTYHTYGYDIVGGGYFNDNIEGVRLWTIQDARDGDVLQLGEVTAIFKKFIGNKNCICYCSICEGEFEIPNQDGDDNNYGCFDATPATKEQRDRLFSKMKEAGYEWDADKKELKKIEESKLTEFEDAIKDMMDDYRDAIDDNDATVEEVKEKAAYLLSLIPCKPAEWSEKDDEMLDSIIEEVRYIGDFPDYPTKEENELYDDCLAKEEWLKSLKDRFTWKPSDEQMDALETAVSLIQSNTLETLYQDLKQ